MFKNIIIVALLSFFVILAFQTFHGPEFVPSIPDPTLTEPYVSTKRNLDKTTLELSSIKAELETTKAALDGLVGEKQQEARWAQAADAESRGAHKTAAKLYDDYAATYPGTKRAQIATWRAKKIRETPAAPAPEPTSTP